MRMTKQLKEFDFTVNTTSHVLCKEFLAVNNLQGHLLTRLLMNGEFDLAKRTLTKGLLDDVWANLDHRLSTARSARVSPRRRLDSGKALISEAALGPGTLLLVLVVMLLVVGISLALSGSLWPLSWLGTHNEMEKLYKESSNGAAPRWCRESSAADLKGRKKLTFLSCMGDGMKFVV